MFKIFKKSGNFLSQNKSFVWKGFVTNRNPENDNNMKSFKFSKKKESPLKEDNSNTHSFDTKSFIDRESVRSINMDITEDKKINSKIFSTKRKMNKSKIKYNKYDADHQQGLSDSENIPKNNFKKSINNFSSLNVKQMNESDPEEESKEHIDVGDYFDMNENNNSKHKDNLNEEKEEDDNQNKHTSDKSEYLYGVHSVEAILKHKFRVLQELYVLFTFKSRPNEHISKLITIAESQNIKVKYMTQGKLDKFTSNRPNDGLVIKCQRRLYSPVKKFKQFSEQHLKKEQGNLIILLDKVTDPQNLGSIIRSCVFIGVEKIIVNKLNCPPISPAVGKISLGASESVELFSLKFTKNFLTDARKSGWKIIATGCDKERSEERNTEKDESEEEEKGENLYTKEQFKSEKIELKDLALSKEDNVIAILGSESLGVSQKLLEISNYQVYIPPVLNKNNVGKFPYDIVDSLNVGVTTGIILNHIKYLQRKDVKKKEVNKNL